MISLQSCIEANLSWQRGVHGSACQAPGQTEHNEQLMDAVHPQTSFLAMICCEMVEFEGNSYGKNLKGKIKVNIFFFIPAEFFKHC